MPYLNRYAFIGHLTKAPELRFQSTADKQALCLLNVAINRDSRDESGEKRTHTTFINDIEVWGTSGENCAHYLTSGSMVMVEGRIDVDQWQDKQSGARRSRLKVVADNVQFLRIKRTGEDAGAAGDAPVPAADSPPSSGDSQEPRAAAPEPEPASAVPVPAAPGPDRAGERRSPEFGDPLLDPARDGDPEAAPSRPTRRPGRAGRAAK